MKGSVFAEAYKCMMNYCGFRFVPDYAGLTHTLRLLTKKNVEW